MRRLRLTSFLILLFTLGAILSARSEEKNIETLITLAHRYYASNDSDRGLDAANEALRMAKLSAVTPMQLAWVLHTIGLGYQIKHDLHKAREFYDEAVAALAQATQQKDPDQERSDLLLSNILNNFAKLNAQERRFVEAESMAKRALDIRSKYLKNFDPGYISVLNTIIDILSDTQREVESLPYLSQLLSIYDHSERDSPQALQVVIRLAHLQEDVGNYPEAEGLYVRALETRQRFLPRGHPNITASMADLAAFLANQGRLEESEYLFKESLMIRMRLFGLKSLEVANLLNDMAAVYATRDPDLAETFLRLALEIHDTIHTEGGRKATVKTNLADLLRVRKKYAEAEMLFAEADDEYGRLGDSRLRGLFLVARGNLHLSLERWGEAETDFKRARDILRVALGSASGAEFFAVQGIVSSHIRRNEWSEAIVELSESTNAIVQGLRRGSDSPGRPLVGATSLSTRVAAKFIGELNQLLYRQALDQPEMMQGNAEAAFEAIQWSTRPAAATAISSMAIRGVAESKRLQDLIRQRQDLVLKWRQDDSRRTFLFATGSSTEVEERQRLQKELFEIDADIRAIDAELQSGFPRYASYANSEPLNISQVQQLLRFGEALVSFQVTEDPSDLPDRAFIWVVTKDDFRWVSLHGTLSSLSEKVAALRCGLDREEWEGIGRPARCGRLLGIRVLPQISDPLPFHLGIAYDLYQELLGSVEDLIKDKHLLIVPSGPLTSLPFQVLVTARPASTQPKTFDGYRGVAWLGRRQPLTILPSVASLQALRRFAKESAAERPYLAYGAPALMGDGSCHSSIAAQECTSAAMRSAGDPMPARERSDRRSGSIDGIFRKGGPGQEAVVEEVRMLCPLPDTAFELRCVAKSLGVPESEIRLGLSSTEADIKRLSERHELENYRVVHFATHGLLAGDIEAMARRQGEPALVMTPPEHPVDADDDGLLTASEIAQLRLNADWVILSACNTAAGDKLGAEALSGLARAFFYAGARALLVSHWPVYSDAAVQLLDHLFAELRQHQTIGKSEALRRAMIALMDDPLQEDNPHPSIWAPFSLVGEGAK